MTRDSSKKPSVKSSFSDEEKVSLIGNDPPNELYDTDKASSKTAQKSNDVLAEPTKNESNTIVLDAELNIAVAEDLYDRMQSFLEQKNEIVLDASNVEAVDSAAFQLLLVFIREAKELNISTRWENVTTKFQNAATLLDIHSHLGV